MTNLKQLFQLGGTLNIIIQPFVPYIHEHVYDFHVKNQKWLLGKPETFEISDYLQQNAQKVAAISFIVSIILL